MRISLFASSELWPSHSFPSGSSPGPSSCPSTLSNHRFLETLVWTSLLSETSLQPNKCDMPLIWFWSIFLPVSFTSFARQVLAFIFSTPSLDSLCYQKWNGSFHHYAPTTLNWAYTFKICSGELYSCYRNSFEISYPRCPLQTLQFSSWRSEENLDQPVRHHHWHLSLCRTVYLHPFPYHPTIFDNKFLIYDVGIWKTYQTSMTDVLPHAPNLSQQRLNFSASPLNSDSKPSKRPPRMELMSKHLPKNLSKSLNPSDQHTVSASFPSPERK